MKFTKLFIILFVFYFPTFAQTNYNVFDTDKILVDGKLTIFTTKQLLEKYLGGSVRKKTFEPQCGFYADEEYVDTKFSFYSKNEITYLVYKNKADLDEIDLSKFKDRFVQFGKFKIDRETKLIDLKRYFPKSYTYYIKTEGTTREKKSFFRLKPCEECDDQIQIILDKNLKVKAVAYWTPC